MLNEIINTDAGKYLLSELTDRKKIEGEIVRISPNSYHVLKDSKDGMAVIEAKLFCDDAVKNKLEPILTKMNIANELDEKALEHHSGLKHYSDYSQVYLVTDTFNSNAGGDGAVRNHGGGSFTWEQLRSGAGDTTDLYATNTTIDAFFAGESDRQYLLRGFYPFDVSSIDSTASVTQSGTKLSLYVNSFTAGQATNTSSVILTTQTNATSLATGDFTQLTKNSPTEGCTRVSTSGLTTSAYNDWAANSNFVTWTEAVIGSGYLKLGIRDGHYDIDANTPANDANNRANVNTSNNASNKPVLTVVYTLASGAIFFGANF